MPEVSGSLEGHIFSGAGTDGVPEVSGSLPASERSRIPLVERSIDRSSGSIVSAANGILDVTALLRLLATQSTVRD